MAINWAFKIAAKLLLARLPIPYRTLKRLGVFGHGSMDSVEYPIKIFRLHAERAYPSGVPAGLVLLELGPGDSVASALLGYAYGASRIYLVDVGAFASRDVMFYRTLAKRLQDAGLEVPELDKAVSLEDVLRACNAEYLTDGLTGLRGLPCGSVDFVWSHSVLEHIRLREFAKVLRELQRILKPGALSSHNVDFQDHLGGALNNLRFPERVWESPLFATSGFYTNRIPAVRMHRMFAEAGFTIEEEAFGRWSALPTPRAAVHADFRRYRDEDLLNRTSHMLLRV
ncbi:MAG: class I SAM-dependent methyltransferase [Deltaproteobacteria bacterium]|jgi:SAM-dependent methyltransferase